MPGSMRPRVFGYLALLSVFLALPACRTTGTPTPGGPVSTIVADCAADPIRNVATHLLDDVASALIVGDWKDALKALAVRAGSNGVEAVKCAVTHLWQDAEKKLTARARMDEATAKRQEMVRDRAKEFIQGS